MSPWSVGDVKKHRKGLDKAQSKRWVKIANAVLAKDGDEGKAIRIANSKCSESTALGILELCITEGLDLSTGMEDKDTSEETADDVEGDEESGTEGYDDGSDNDGCE